MRVENLPYWQQMREALIVLYGKIETIENLQKLKGEKFNIFSVLKMERLEVETHSALIYELINPLGTHCQGNKYLDLFVRHVLNIDDFDLTDVCVKREEMTDEGRRIDLSIKNKKYFIVIEMKIDAGDQPQQLSDYKIYADSKEFTTKLYYLTLDGKDASNESITDDKNEKVDYAKISFSYHMLEWIEACIEKSSLLPTIRETLLQYANVIRKMTGQTTKEITMQVVELINNPKIAQAATEMAQNLGYVWALKEAKFWHDLCAVLDEKNDKHGWKIREYDLMFDGDIFIEDEKERALKIAEARASRNEEIGLICQKTFTHGVIEVYICQYNSTGLRYYLKSTKAIDTLSQAIGTNRKDKQSRYGDSLVNVNFYGKNVTNPSYELFDESGLKQLMHSVANEAIAKLEKINQIMLSIKRN